MAYFNERKGINVTPVSMLFFLVFWPMAGAVISYIAGMANKKGRDLIVNIVTAIEFVVIGWMLYLVFQGEEPAVSVWDGFCGMGISLKFDGFRALYGTVAGFMWLATSLFSREYFASHYRNRNRYYFFYLMTLGATMGVFLSADLFTTFIFFEIMSFTSYVWVAHDETKEALKAAETYLAVAIIGGMAMLIGLMMLYHEAGTLTIDELYAACSAVQNKTPVLVSGILMLTGFGAKAGMFPLHIWLPKAHPVAPAPASALLSGILTKSGIFGVLVISCNIFRHDPAWGKLILFLGVITMFWGAFLAIFSVNFKRTLACSSMSQIGFILVGIGMICLLGEENAMAVRGTLLHMMNHSLFKLLLFMVAGVIYMNTHKLNLNDLRGWGKDKPLLKVLYLSGALGIGGIPLFSGYVSKTLLHESIVEYGEILAGTGVSAGWVTAVEWIFLLTGGMTLAYMTKLFIAVFVDKPAAKKQTAKEKKMAAKGIRKPYMSRLTAVTLSAVAVILPVFGILPSFTMDKLADITVSFFSAEEAGNISYFSLNNLKGALISILIGAVLYVLIRRFLTKADEAGNRVYLDVWPEKLDLEDYGYRPLIGKVLLPVLGAVSVFCNGLVDRVTAFSSRTVFSEKSEDYWIEKGMTVQKFRRKALTRREQILASSLSFGLLLCAAGMVMTLLYLLFWR